MTFAIGPLKFQQGGGTFGERGSWFGGSWVNGEASHTHDVAAGASPRRRVLADVRRDFGTCRLLGHAGAVLAWLAVPLAPGNTKVGSTPGPTVSEVLPVGSSFEAGVCSSLLRARASWELSRMKLKARKPRGR